MFAFQASRSLSATTCALTFMAALTFAACSADGGSGESVQAAAAETTSSRARALAIADEVMEAVGGLENWDATRFITWVNHGKRLEVWDKLTGDIRVENDAVIVLMNIHSQEGRAWRFGQEITDPADLQRTLEFGYEAFQLDRHEILLPFMLRDEGFILDYLGEGEVDGQPVDVLKVTFEEGEPYSRAEYHLQIDKESRLLVQWDYYMDEGDETPRFFLPWSNYKKYGNILLSDLRGMKQHQDVNVFDELPASVLESHQPVPWLRADE